MANFTDFTAAISIAQGDYLEGHLAGEGVDSERKFTALAVGQGAFQHAGQYAELDNESNTSTTSFTGGPSSNFSQKRQVVFATANGTEQGLDGDNTQDHITVGTTGVYFMQASLSVSGGANDTLSFAVFGNNGATQFTPRSTVKLDAGGSVTNVVVSGVGGLSVGNTIEIWAQNETSSVACTIEDSAFSIFRIG
jgi:hypothetical protein